MSLIKKIVEIVERSDMVDAKKHINKLNREIKDHKEKVNHFLKIYHAKNKILIQFNRSVH